MQKLLTVSPERLVAWLVYAVNRYTCYVPFVLSMCKLHARVVPYRRSCLGSYVASPLAVDADRSMTRPERGLCPNVYVSVYPYESFQSAEHPMKRADVSVSVDEIPVPGPSEGGTRRIGFGRQTMLDTFIREAELEIWTAIRSFLHEHEIPRWQLDRA